MQQQQPQIQAFLTNAVDVIAGENGERRNRGQNVARQLGMGEGKNDDREKGPQNQKFGKGIAPAGMADVMVFGEARPPLRNRLLDRVHQRAHGDDRPGHQREQHDGDVVPNGLLMHVAVGGEAFQVVFQEKDAQKIRITPLYRDIPGQHHGEIEKHPGDPDRAAKQGPLPPQSGKGENDEQGHGRSHGAFGQRGHADEEIEVEEPELLVRLIPGIPAEHADAEGRGHLHIGGGAAGEADDAGARGGNQRGIQLAPGPEAAEVQIDQRDQDESKAGRGRRADQSCTPNSRKANMARQ